MAGQAADRGARFIATPEATNILERSRPRLAAEIRSLDDDPVVQGLRALAAELDVELLIGSALVRRDDGGFANRSVLIGPSGEIQATYDKIHSEPINKTETLYANTLVQQTLFNDGFLHDASAVVLSFGAHMNL